MPILNLHAADRRQQDPGGAGLVQLDVTAGHPPEKDTWTADLFGPGPFPFSSLEQNSHSGGTASIPFIEARGSHWPLGNVTSPLEGPCA
jgi:hypothetical protein